MIQFGKIVQTLKHLIILPAGNPNGPGTHALELDNFKLRRSLRKRMNQFEFRFDSAFEEVMRECATIHRPGQKGSWILEDVIEAYSVLHGMGYAHSIEAYQDGKLVGGLYGVVVGRVFCGESMFAKVTDASKAAFAVLVAHLKAWDFDFIDAQVPTEHLKSLGAVEIGRSEFLSRLHVSRDKAVTALWHYNSELLKNNGL